MNFHPVQKNISTRKSQLCGLNFLLKIVSGFSVNPLPSGCVAVPERERELLGISRGRKMFKGTVSQDLSINTSGLLWTVVCTGAYLCRSTGRRSMGNYDFKSPILD
jgi:hypothetical protein